MVIYSYGIYGMVQPTILDVYVGTLGSGLQGYSPNFDYYTPSYLSLQHRAHALRDYLA